MGKFLLPLLIFCCFSVSAQDTIQIKQHILQCGDSMAIALKQRDWTKLAGYSVPAVVEMMGGEKGFAEMSEMMMKEIPDTAIQYFKIGPVVQLLKTKEGWQCIVEQHMKMNMQGIKISSMSPLLGIADEKGEKWRFIDTKGDAATAKMFVPEMSDALIIPKPVMNTVYPQMEAPKKSQ